MPTLTPSTLSTRSERRRGQTRGACMRTSASSVLGSAPASQYAHQWAARPAIVNLVLLPAVRCAHLHTLGDGIEGPQRHTAGVRYPRTIVCTRLRSKTPIFPVSAARKK